MTVAEQDRPALLRPEEAAALLQVSRSKVYRLISEKRLPAVRLTGSVRIPRAALMEMLDAATDWPESPMASR
jgi:excisionase family DNA binding protein